jgi:hypothetical protein
MALLRFSLRAAYAAAIAGLLAACSQSGSTILPSGGLAPAGIALPDAVPPKCKGQKDTKQYASLTATLQTSGGSFCIPEFGGFGGTVEYPTTDPSIKVTVTTSTTDYDSLPQLGSGKAIVYIQLALSGGTAFGDSVKAGGGLTAKKIVSGKPYTAFGEAMIDSIEIKFTPCYAVATKGKYGGVIGGLGTLLKGQLIPAAASGFIELYPGKQATSKC